MNLVRSVKNEKILQIAIDINPRAWPWGEAWERQGSGAGQARPRLGARTKAKHRARPGSSWGQAKLCVEDCRERRLKLGAGRGRMVRVGILRRKRDGNEYPERKESLG